MEGGRERDKAEREREGRGWIEGGREEEREREEAEGERERDGTFRTCLGDIFRMHGPDLFYELWQVGVLLTNLRRATHRLTMYVHVQYRMTVKASQNTPQSR